MPVQIVGTMIPCITESKLRQFKALVDGARMVSVISHTHPDGDAVGSSAALGAYLCESLGKDAMCILPDTPPASISFIIPKTVPYIFADTASEAAEDRILKSDLIIMIDLNKPSRAENLEASIRKSSATRILIDHHLGPEEEAFNLIFTTPEISSASELLYWMLRSLAGPAENIPAEAREALCAGMTTDTNNFANSVFPSTFTMASELIASGTDRNAIIAKLYNQYRENRIRLMGWMQCQEMKITAEGAARMILTKELQQRFGYQEGETEGLVNVPLAINRVKLSILLTQHKDCMRVSIRSKQGTSARDLAMRWFNGGGHENAAGGKLVIGVDIPDAAAADAYVEQALKEFLG